MKALPIALLFLVVAPNPAAAQPEPIDRAAGGPTGTAGGDEEIVVEGEVPKEKRRVCEMRATTGSIVPKRVCRTVAQIEADQQAARDTMERVSRDRETRDTIQGNRGPGV